MNTLSWEYLAGFIDGEGHISIIRRIKKGRKLISYHPTIMITNTYLDVLLKIKDFIGCGNIVTRKNTSTKDRLVHRLIINPASNIENILKCVLPFLVVKKVHAEIVYKFVCSRLKERESFKLIINKTFPPIGSSPPYTEEEIEIYSKIEKLMPRPHKNKIGEM